MLPGLDPGRSSEANETESVTIEATWLGRFPQTGGERRPWKATMERHLTRVAYREMYFCTMFLCCGEKASEG